MTYWKFSGVYTYWGGDQFGFTGVINDTDIRNHKDQRGKFAHKSGDYLQYKTNNPDDPSRAVWNYFRFDTVEEIQGNINTEVTVTHYYDRDTDSYLEVVENRFLPSRDRRGAIIPEYFTIGNSVGALVKRGSGENFELARIDSSRGTTYNGTYSYIEGRYEYNNGDYYSIKGFISDEFGGGEALYSWTDKKLVHPSTSAKDSFVENTNNSTGRYIIEYDRTGTGNELLGIRLNEFSQSRYTTEFDTTGTGYKSFFKSGNWNHGIKITSFYQHSSGKLHVPTSITLGVKGLGSESAVFDGEIGSQVSIRYDTLPESRILTLPTYSLNLSATTITEGGTLTTSISTTNVASGTTFYYSLSGTGITASDFSAGALTGQVTTSTNGTASFSHTLASDLTTEGSETLQIKLFSDSARTIQVGSTASVTISDTSTTPAPTYSLTPSVTTINEGGTLTTSISTTNVASGTTLYYALSGTGISTADFSSGALTGQVTTSTNGTASFSHTLASDLTTEGSETLQIKLFSDSARTIQVGSTASVSISDTSTTPAPTYSLTPSLTTINEGSTLTNTVTTTNLAAGTTLYYALSGTGVTAADFSSGSLTGSGSIGPDGKFSFSHTLASDLTTEGNEYLEIKLFTDSARSNLVATTASLIQDTSTTPIPTYSINTSSSSVREGDSFSTTVSASNLPAGTPLYYALSGTGITSADFSSGVLIGNSSGSIGPDGKFSFSHTLANDLTTEGTENLEIKLFTDSARINQVATTTIAIQDTSTTPIPTYSFNTSSSSVREGDSFSTTVSTTNLPAGTTLYYALKGPGITAADFSSGSLTGSGSIAPDGKFHISHTLASDLTTEGQESIDLLLYTDSLLTNQVARSSLTIQDSSLTPAPPAPPAPPKKPLLTASDVSGDLITLRFDRALSTTRPSSSAFSVTADSRSISVISASASADGTVSVKLNQPVQPSQVVRLSYRDLSDDQSFGVIEGTDGTDVDSFSADLSNLTRDTIAPQIQTASVNLSTLELTFNEQLKDTVSSKSQFQVSQESKTIAVTSIKVDPSAGQATLTLAQPVKPRLPVTLSYKDLDADQSVGVIQDLSGNDLATIANLPVDNQTIGSATPLRVALAEVDGTSLTLSFDREIDATDPSARSFRVTVNGRSISVNRAQVFPADRQVALTLASPASPRDTVTVSYTDALGDQRTGVVQDIDGNDLLSFQQLPVKNTTPAINTLTLENSEVIDRAIRLTFSEPLAATLPASARFLLTADNKRQSITSIESTPADGVITLNLSKAIAPSAKVLLSYSDPNGDQSSGVIEDTFGNDLLSIQNHPITNFSVDQDPPTLIDALLDGSELTLQFDELLSPGTIPSSRFSIKVNGKRVKASNAKVLEDDTTAVLNLTAPVSEASKVLISYLDPRNDQSTGVIQDTTGNDLLSLRDFAVEVL